MITLPEIRHFKFRNKLLLFFLIVLLPLMLISKTLLMVQSKKFIEAGIEKELDQRLIFLTDLIRTASDIPMKTRLNTVASLTSRQNGYVFIVDENGGQVLRPFMQANNMPQSGAFSDVVSQMLKKKSGKIRTIGFAPDRPSGEHLIIFRYLPQYKWIIGAAGDAGETATILKRLATFIILNILAFFIAFAGLFYLLSRSVIRPLKNFAHILDSSQEDGNLNIRWDYNAKDEVGNIARHFNTFMARIDPPHDQTNTQEGKQTSAGQDNHKANELKRQELFNQSFQLIAILSPHGILEDVNESQLAFSQCKATDILYKPYWETPWCLHDETCRQKIKQAVENAARGETVRLETTFSNGHGHIKDIDISLKPVFSDEHVAFIVTESRDVTESKLAESERSKLLIQLQKAQKLEAIGTLAGGIAHDFNNILSSIFGYAQLAQMNLDNPEKLNNHMKQILKGAQRASDLVKQILTFSRQAENEKSSLRLHLVVKEALKLLRSSIPSTIEMVTRVETRDMVNADPTQMHKMIMNLCTNAYHAMTSGGTLTVSLTTVDQIPPEHQSKDYLRPGPFLKLMVQDTGHGMNPETIEKAFDPYFTTKEVGRGTGIGLALVGAIIEDHQGLVHIESISGQGTSFFVYLPVVTKNKAAAADSHTGVETFLQPGKETIMLVDDEPDILALIEELLNKFGYSVHAFNNGETALNAYKEGKINFDMVITDMTMPRLTGIALAEAILSDNKNTPIILCSGFNETISRSKIKAIGVSAFLEKPLDTHQLLKTMRTLFDHK